MADPTGIGNILQGLMGGMGPQPNAAMGEGIVPSPMMDPLNVSWADVKKGLRAMGVKPTADLEKLWAQRMSVVQGAAKDPRLLDKWSALFKGAGVPPAARGALTPEVAKGLGLGDELLNLTGKWPARVMRPGGTGGGPDLGLSTLSAGLPAVEGPPGLMGPPRPPVAPASAPTAVEQLAAVPRQVVATPVMPKMGFWDRLMGTTQTIVPGETAGAVGSGTRAAGRTLDVAAEMSSRGNLDANIATLGFDPRAVSTAAKAAAQAKVPLAGAAAGAAETAAAAAAELGWKEAYQKGTGALLKKIATVATTKRPTAAGSFGKGLGSLFLIMLAQQLWSSLLQHGVLMPGGKGLEDLQKEAVGQQAQAALGMAKAQMPSESALLAQAMLGPMQQQAGQAQQAALQSGAQMSDMGWM